MIIENTGIKGAKSELGWLDQVMFEAEFVREQWEYYRATYDFQIEHQNEAYFLRINTRAIEGKLENKFAVLEVEDAYIGRATYPAGLDYDSPIPDTVLNSAKQKLSQIKAKLS